MTYDIVEEENGLSPVAIGEALNVTQKMVVRLRAVKEARKLTVAQVEEMVNFAVSRTTLNRFFAQDSETRYNFNYQYTILPIQRALLVEDTMDSGDEIAKAKASSYEAAFQEKDEQIDELKRQQLRMRDDFELKCSEYEKRLELWQKQIEKKDERMDRKDKVIQEKDAEIRALRARLDELTSELLEIYKQQAAAGKEKV